MPTCGGPFIIVQLLFFSFVIQKLSCNHLSAQWHQSEFVQWSQASPIVHITQGYTSLNSIFNLVSHQLVLSCSLLGFIPKGGHCVQDGGVQIFTLWVMHPYFGPRGGGIAAFEDYNPNVHCGDTEEGRGTFLLLLRLASTFVLFEGFPQLSKMCLTEHIFSTYFLKSSEILLMFLSDFGGIGIVECSHHFFLCEDWCPKYKECAIRIPQDLGGFWRIQPVSK